ncbi:hypothetical protein [Pseudarthrobacter sp. BRE9]|uniref:hypothetical protein n=1 Tax=Pseudarthrobacter sp. BRE9 TaxID=2962582 RepID=UPI002882A22B|nr:hypothetical protein [Pseudarthrobacter sp. BRE9]MDT0167780.1 hypothetical protein [Pseudarthrobacter sp. BRE9]
MNDEGEERREAVRWVSWTAGLFVLVLFFALVDLSVPLFFQSRPEFYEGYLLETGWGVLFTFFVGIPLCVLGCRPGSASAALLPVAAVTAVLAAAMASARPGHLLIVAGLLVPSAVKFLPDGSIELKALLKVGRLHRPTLVISVVALPAAVLFAAEMATTAREGRAPVDFTWDFDHWPIQAAAALVIPLAAAVLSFRLPGWRPMVFIVAAGAAWFGTVSIVYPDHAGSLGTVTGWTSIIWAAVLAASAFHKWAQPRSIRP